MGFDAEIYANKVVRWKDINNKGTYVLTIERSFCEFLKPNFSKKGKSYGTFKVTREYLETRLKQELETIQTTISEILIADYSESQDTNINDKIYFARTIKEILQNSNAETFVIRWDC